VKTIPLAIATRNPALNPILRRANKLVFLSEESLEQYEKHDPANLVDRAVIVPNFAEDVPDRPGEITQLGQHNWLYVGRLSEEKGILPLLEHWPQNEGLVVVGDGPLDEEARRISRGKKVTFLGNLSKDRVADQMARARGLIFPSICLENSPLVVAEALGHSLPVIAKSGNVAAQLVSHFGAGAVIEDFSEITQPLEMVSSQRAEMGHLARKLFEQQFSQKKWLRRMNAVYEDVHPGDSR
jgi:glycosyltransferase involved in cell wall biosynthesis